jgi:hypothetical protein
MKVTIRVIATILLVATAILAIGIISPFSRGEAQTLDEAAQSLQYSNNESGYMISFPNNWFLVPAEGKDGVTSIQSFNPYSGGTGVLKEEEAKLDISPVEVTPGMTSQELALENTHHPDNVIRRDRVHIGDTVAVKQVSAGEDGGQVVNYYLAGHNKGFIISGYGNLDRLQRIADSFRLVE